MKQEIDMSKYTIGIDPYDKQETLEEVAENFWLNDDSMTDNDRISYVNGFEQGAKWQQQNSYSEEEVNEMFDTLKRNSIDNVSTISNVDLFISSWKQEFKKK